MNGENNKRADFVRDLEDGFTVIPSELKKSFQRE
jgi:hypothetical protein